MTLEMVFEVLEELWRSLTVHVVIDAKQKYHDHTKSQLVSEHTFVYSYPTYHEQKQQ